MKNEMYLEESQTTKIYKCVFYARVSTKNKSQEDSCKHQRWLMDSFVERHPNYQVEEYYVDDGISGKTIERPDYQKLLDRIKKGDIDYIFAKDNDRLNRSVEGNADLNKWLISTETSIYYLMDETTYNPRNVDEWMCNCFKSFMGQGYVMNVSNKAKLYHKQKCENLILNPNNITYGYEWDSDNKKVVINKDQADIVRYIYELYVYQDMGVSDISRLLYNECGITGERSKNLLSARTLNQILTNTAYIGKIAFNKSETIDTGIGVGAKKKRRKLSKEEWVYAPYPKIFEDTKLWDLAQKIRKERNHVYNAAHSKEETRSFFKGMHTFATKVFCGSCGSQYQFCYTDRKHEFPLYKDYFGKKTKDIHECCNNKEYNKIYEKTLENITINGFNMIVENKDEIIENLLSILKEAMDKAQNDNSNIESLNKRLAKVNKEKELAMAKWVQAPTDELQNYCVAQIDKCNEEIEAIKTSIEKEQKRSSDILDISKQLEKIKDYLGKVMYIDKVDRDFVDHMVDRIVINEDGKLFITFKFMTQALTTTLNSFSESKKAIRNGLPTIHIIACKTLADLLRFFANVGKIGGEDTMEVFPLDMQILQGIC
jgi:DNA invertase Pin-like site-specific DNA recombinase